MITEISHKREINEDELKEMFSQALEKQKFKRHYALDKFLSILFWKDYGSGHVLPDLKQEIYDVIDSIQPKRSGDNEWLQLDTKKAVNIANKIRKIIGMKNLILENNMILEDSGEIKNVK